MTLEISEDEAHDIILGLLAARTRYNSIAEGYLSNPSLNGYYTNQAAKVRDIAFDLLKSLEDIAHEKKTHKA